MTNPVTTDPNKVTGSPAVPANGAAAPAKSDPAEPGGTGAPVGGAAPAGKRGKELALSGKMGQSQIGLPEHTKVTTKTTVTKTTTTTVTTETTTETVSESDVGGASPAASGKPASDAPNGPAAAGQPGVGQPGPGQPAGTQVPGYQDTFGNQSYVKDGQNKDLVGLARKMVDKVPELEDTALAQHIKDGNLSPDDVKGLQNVLQAKGYSVGHAGVDGKYGPETHAALQKLLGGAPQDMTPPAAPSGHPTSTETPSGQPAPSPGQPSSGTPTESNQEYNVGGPQPAVKRQGKYIGKDIAGKFDAMVAAAKKDGVNLTINSGMRTRAEQEALYQKYHGKRPVALPGHSEHEQGHAIDFGNTPGAYSWLKQHAAKFGFHNLPSEAWHYSTSGH